LALGVMIIVAILTSSLTYYYVMSNVPTTTATVTLSTTITSTSTATRSVVTTETSTVTMTKYVTLPPSTTTVTVTETPTATQGWKIVAQRNDTAAEKLIEFELKERLSLAILIWLTWLKTRSGTASTTPYNNPATALAAIIASRLGTLSLDALPPLAANYSVRYSETPVTIHSERIFSGNGSCVPVDITSWGKAINVSALLEPVNASAAYERLSSNVSAGISSVIEEVTVVSGATVKTVEKSKFIEGNRVTTVARVLATFHNYVPVMLKVISGSLTREIGINASNGALIIKMSGSTIKVVKGVGPALNKVLESLKIVITYAGTTNLTDNFIVPTYRIIMNGDVNVSAGDIGLSIKLSYDGLAYLIDSNAILFAKNSINSLRANVTVGSSAYCGYLLEPLTTQVKVKTLGTG